MRPAARCCVAHPARVLAASCVLLGRPAALGAQAATVTSATRRVRQAVAVNPIAIPLGGLSGAYERALGTAGLAFGVGPTVSLDNSHSRSSADRAYASGPLKLKYHPSENGLHGFAVGATLGVVHGRDYVYEDYTLPCALPGCTLPGCTSHPQRASAALAGFLAPAAAAAGAQAGSATAGSAPAGGTPPPLPYDQTLSAGLLTIPFGVVSAEYERRLGPRGVTVAATGTYATTSQLYPRRDRWAEGRVMYYPGGRALEGFAVGVSAGAHRAARKYGEDPAVVLAHDGGATLGVLGTYNTFYGPRRRVFFGTGVGVKWVLKSVAVNSPLSATYFEGRAAFGVAF